MAKSREDRINYYEISTSELGKYPTLGIKGLRNYGHIHVVTLSAVSRTLSEPSITLGNFYRANALHIVRRAFEN